MRTAELIQSSIHVYEWKCKFPAQLRSHNKQMSLLKLHNINLHGNIKPKTIASIAPLMSANLALGSVIMDTVRGHLGQCIRCARRYEAIRQNPTASPVQWLSIMLPFSLKTERKMHLCQKWPAICRISLSWINRTGRRGKGGGKIMWILKQLNVVDRDCGIQDWMTESPLDCYYSEYDTSPQAA